MKGFWVLLLDGVDGNFLKSCGVGIETEATRPTSVKPRQLVYIILIEPMNEVDALKLV